MTLRRILARFLVIVLVSAATQPLLSVPDRVDAGDRHATGVERLSSLTGTNRSCEGAILVAHRARFESAARSNQVAPGLLSQTSDYTAPGRIGAVLHQPFAAGALASPTSLALRGPPSSI